MLLITPARDEAAHLERTIRAVLAQTPPARPLADRRRRLHRRDPARSSRAPPPSCPSCEVLQRAAAGSASRARTGWRSPPRRGPSTRPWRASTSTSSPTSASSTPTSSCHPTTSSACSSASRAEPELGVAGGTLLEQSGGGWRPTKVPAYHVRGALKLYSRECFAAIGGIEERLGWDTIDETYARMRGYATRSLPELAARHHRPVATRGGALRGRARHGQCAYILRYGAWWVALRSLKVACSRPYGLSGLAFLYGYLRSAVRRDDRVEDERVPALRRPRAARSGARPRSAAERKSQISWRTRKFLRFSCVHKPMAFVDTIRQLWRRKLLVGLVLVLAVARRDLQRLPGQRRPSGLEKRALSVAAASSQILVDSPDSRPRQGRRSGHLRSARDPGQNLRPVPGQPLDARQKIAKLRRRPGRLDRHQRPLQRRHRPDRLRLAVLRGTRRRTAAGRRRQPPRLHRPGRRADHHRRRPGGDRRHRDRPRRRLLRHPQALRQQPRGRRQTGPPRASPCASSAPRRAARSAAPTT